MDRKKIVLIGPVYPYKGGIAHYTSLMYRALCRKYDVVMVSYKFQYPRLLYKKEQRDYSNDNFKIDDTNYWIHTADPFNWIGTAHKINRLAPALVILQWWHPYFAPCYWMMCRLLKNTKILFVCHNVFPHERFPLDRLLTRAVLKRGSRYIVQSETDAEDLRTVVKNPVFRQTVHPTYNAFKIAGISGEEARKILGISQDKKVLLFFGFIREYKGLSYLIQAMPEVIRQVEDTELLVVGDFSGPEDRQRYLDMIQEYALGDHVTVYDGYIPDQEVEKFFAACNLVVLPYISATQSGIAQIAYGFEKPVVATNVGGLPDVVDDGSTGYVVEAGNAAKLAEGIVDYFIRNREKEFAENIRKEADRFSWDRMADLIAELESC